MRRHHRTKLIHLFPPLLALLFVWAVFVRHLGLESMWYDENISWSVAISPTLGDFFGQWPLGTGHPPLYFFTLWAWIKWTGNVDLLVMRLSATIPMLLAVAWTYRLGREWFPGRWGGLAALLFMGTNGVVIYYARELRMYGLLALLAVISWWLLRRFAERGDRRALLGYAVAVALMGYTHYLAAVLVAAQALAVLVLYRRRFPALLAGYALAALLVLSWLPTFIAQQQVAGVRAGQAGAIGQFAATEPTTWNSVSGFITRYTAGQFSFVALLVALGLSLGLRRANGPHYRRRVLMTVIWLLVPVTLVLLGNLAIPLFNPRYVQWIIPAAALLAGVGAQQLPARARLPLLAVIAAGGVVTHTAAFDAPKTPHRELLTTVAARFQPGDRLWYNLSHGALGSTTGEEVRYYLREVVPELNDEDFIWDAPKDFADPAVKRVWDVRPYFIPMPEEAAAALGERVLTEENTFGAYFVRLYEPHPDDNTPAARLSALFAVAPPGERERVVSAGAVLPLAMWWRALQPPELDYSYVLLLRRAGEAIAQWDGGLALGGVPTSGWSPDGGYGLVRVDVALPADLPPGDYTLWVGAYYWEQPTRLPVSADAGVETDAEARLALVLRIRVVE